MAEIMLKNVGIGFPAVGVPKAIGEGTAAYGGKLILDPNHPQVKAIEAMIVQVAKEKWKDKADDVLDMLYEDDKVCFRKKPYRSKRTGKVFEGFEDMYHLSTRHETTVPSVFDRFNKQVHDAALKDQLIYSGCIVHAKIEIWAQDNQFGRRINGTLNGVMWAGEGQRFGGGAGPASSSDFADFAQEPDFGAADADDLV